MVDLEASYVDEDFPGDLDLEFPAKVVKQGATFLLFT
eukprot:CAMPEP_0119049622 /NCGR_PEP_ID=MMETSP1177-20130426/65614_1 /TAXON_ID=2985 /ORGANISM="Ochromonas sp, Strain CCMP1899" /LENGTH=36 /DNA_ID= /DNA_START= /DNA_END= /DNA_ORIENTATION=